MNGLECKCGNKDQTKFFVHTETVGFERLGPFPITETRPIKKFVGYLCGGCGLVKRSRGGL